MTITYTSNVASAKALAFCRLLFRWKGSVYQLLYKEAIIFGLSYALISIIYRRMLNNEQRSEFENVAIYCNQFADFIPLSFVLGFYVGLVVTRWWNQLMQIPFPDRLMMYVSSLIIGNDDATRMTRRTIMRWVNLSCVLLFRDISVVIHKRFPTMEHVLNAGIMTADELKQFDSLPTPYHKYWVPIQWSFNLLSESRATGKIKSDYQLITLFDELMKFRDCAGNLFAYDWIPIPLVYTQVTTLAVYTFFITAVIGRQFLDPNKGYMGHESDLYIPVYTILQFFFYMGWLKVAQVLINPFGEDDDDFETNWVVDRNLQVSLLAVDEMHMTYPTPTKDIYWDETNIKMPQTVSSYYQQNTPFVGSLAPVNVENEEMEIVNEEVCPNPTCQQIHSSVPRIKDDDCKYYDPSHKKTTFFHTKLVPKVKKLFNFSSIKESSQSCSYTVDEKNIEYRLTSEDTIGYGPNEEGNFSSVIDPESLNRSENLMPPANRILGNTNKL